MPKGANSGVGIRTPLGKWPSTDGMEIQILDDNDPKYKDVKPNTQNGSIYSFVAPKAHPAKPAGEWNSIRILCQGSNIQVWINEHVVKSRKLLRESGGSLSQFD